MTTTTATSTARLLTNGAVCARLRDEFPDISISKIRYLEDQGLLAPKRTRGGYRLFDEDDVDRLETILRLQRDEFLPLRVIRDELDSPAAAADRVRKRAPGLGETEGELELSELCEHAGITPDFVRQLEDFGLLTARVESGHRLYRQSDAEVAAACGKLARFGVDARHLRTFRSTASRQAAFLEQLVAPALRSRNPERHKDGIEELRALATISQELAQLLFWRDVRAVADR